MIRLKVNLKIKTPKIDTYYPNLKLGKLIQAILKNLTFTEGEANEFLNSHTLDFEDPFKIFGMKKAAKFLDKAIRENKKIAIHGDFDVDGVSATAILWDYLFYERKVECLPIIPHRVDEGYGLSEKTIQKAIDWGASVLITVDCGVKDITLVEKYKDKIDFVITDHHQFATNEKGEIVLPAAKAVVHSAYPKSKFGTMISGAATAWELVRALEQRAESEEQRTGNKEQRTKSKEQRTKSKEQRTENKEQRTEDKEQSFRVSEATCHSTLDTRNFPLEPVNLNQYLDLVALSTVCDIIPLTLENRKLIQSGLRQIMSNERLGLSELMRIAQIEAKNISCYHFGFILGPRLNAPGRVTNDAMDALRLLSTKNELQARDLAKKLNELNLKRQELTKHYLELAEKGLDPTKRALVIVGEDWPEGILGLVAGKLAEKYFRPTFVASLGEEGKITGSSRSPLENVYLNKVLEHAKDHLTRYGGHKQAAGFGSVPEKFEGFEEKVIEFLTENSIDQDYEPIMEIDLELSSLSGISISDIEELTLLEPHGIGNPRPLFLFKKCTIQNYSRLGKEGNHLKLNLKFDNEDLEAIGFNLAEKYKDLAVGDVVDIIGYLGINQWNGNRKVQVEMRMLIE